MSHSCYIANELDMFPTIAHVESIILMTYCGSEGK